MENLNDLELDQLETTIPINNSDQEVKSGPAIERPKPSVEAKSKVKHLIKPGGHWNRNFGLIVLVGAAFVGAWLMVPSDSNSQTSAKPAMKSAPTPIPSMDVVAPVENLSSGIPTTDMPDTSSTDPQPSPIATPGEQQKFTAPISGSAPFGVSSTTQQQVVANQVENPQVSSSPQILAATDSFGTPLRASVRHREENHVNSSTPQVETLETKEDKRDNMLRLARGARVPLLLLEPLESGLPTRVTARVTQDVKNAQNEIVIPRNSIAHIPFSGFERNGRLPNNDREPIFIVFPSGEDFKIEGSVRGADKKSGLAGIIKKKGKPNALKRVGGAVARAGTSAIGSVTGRYGGYSTYDIQQAIGGENDYMYSADRVVEVPSHTSFYLITGYGKDLE